MKITVDIRHDEVASALAAFEPDRADLGGMGTFWISTDDEVHLAVLIVNNTNKVHESYGELSAMKGMTEYVYLITGPASNSQLLAVQEIGAFTVTFGSMGDDYNAMILYSLPKFIEFVSNPKRRAQKNILPARSTKAFTLGEQMALIIPGIGPAKLGMLLNQCKSIAWILSMMTWYDTADTFDGVVTPTMIAEYRQMLQLDDNQILSVVSSE